MGASYYAMQQSIHWLFTVIGIYVYRANFFEALPPLTYVPLFVKCWKVSSSSIESPTTLRSFEIAENFKKL